MPRAKAPVGEIEAPERPKPPAHVRGQARVVDYFSRIGPEKLSHAYLFTGPRGVGKLSFARALALTLHCENPSSFPLGYCGACGACRRGIAGSSGDVVVVDDAFIASLDPNRDRKIGGLNIDAAHEIIRLMQLRSYEGGRLVCIIPRFDNITYDYVYNALLKELEEPDPGKLFLLTAERPERILPTIRSRAVGVRFERLSERDVADALERDRGVPVDRARALARRSQGSLGDAIDELAEGVGELRAAARRWALACLARPGALPEMPDLGKDEPRTVLAEVLRYARLAVRDLMAYVLAGESAVMDVDALDEYRKTHALLGVRAGEIAIHGLSMFDEADRIAITNVAPGVILGWLQVQLRSIAAQAQNAATR